MQSDPLGLDGGLSTYAYAMDNPIINVDPLGLAVWVCTRGVDGFPFVGNHAYLWDDKRNESCGMQGSFGLGPKGKDEKGPTVDTCVKVPGSDGKERKILRCCLGKANNGLWFPKMNDCHNAVADCITENGLKPPEAPGGRLGPRCEGEQCKK